MTIFHINIIVLYTMKVDHHNISIANIKNVNYLYKKIIIININK